MLIMLVAELDINQLTTKTQNHQLANADPITGRGLSMFQSLVDKKNVEIN